MLSGINLKSINLWYVSMTFHKTNLRFWTVVKGKTNLISVVSNNQHLGRYSERPVPNLEFYPTGGGL